MIKRISKELFVEYVENYKEEILKYFEEDIFYDNDNFIFYAYLEDGEIIGVCSITPYENEIVINNCFVTPDRRKEGILTNMVEYAKKISDCMDMDLVAMAYVETSYSTFKKCGFKEVGSALQKMIYKKEE